MVKGTTRAAVLLAALVPMACGDGPTSPSGIVDTEWRLASIELPGAAVATNARPDRYTLRLGPDGVAGALVSCNSCGGRYELAGDRLLVSSLACTLAFCAPLEGEPPAVGSFPSLLEGRSAAVVDAAGLTIRSERGTLRFVR